MTTSLEYSSDYPLQGLTLLVSDDEMRLRQIIVLMAEELGATVIDVETSEKAIAVYAQKQQEIDLVMLDLRMAGMSGESAYRKIKEMNPGAKVVLSSGIRPEEDFVAELESNGSAFIEKPFDMDGLATILCKLAERPFK
jgi:two-component system, cell cycle sensor histidine kinase and response regulator CckA